MYAVLAILPITLAVVMMTALKQKSGRSMAACWALCFLFAIAFWNLNIMHAITYTVAGFLGAIDTIIIIFGALFLLNSLIKMGYIDSIGQGFNGITHDRRIQILIIGWLFGGFIEGAAGFGTPAALAGPLLVGLGIPPFAAAMASLIANSTPVVFGAVGVPPITGANIAAGAAVAQFGEAVVGPEGEWFRQQFFSRLALMNLCTGTFVPILIVAAVCLRYGGKVKDVVQVLPLCIVSGLCMTLTALPIAMFVGPELPSMLGSLIGIVIMVTVVKAGFLVPKDVWRFPDDPIAEATPLNTPSLKKNDVPLLTAWSPYVVIAALICLGRLPMLQISGKSLREIFLRNPALNIQWSNILGASTVKSVVDGVADVNGISWLWRPLDNPGIFPFILVTLLYLLLSKHVKNSEIGGIFKKTVSQTKNAAIALFFGVATVQLMRYTNYSQLVMAAQGLDVANTLSSMTTEVAKALAAIFGGVYPLIAPVIGIFGAFVAGSHTVSNTMFASLQFETAVLVELPTVLMVICQAMGGAIGNMICVNNVVAVSATTGADGQEGKLIASAMIPCIVFSLLVSMVAFIFIGALNWLV